MVKNYIPPGERQTSCPSCGTSMEGVPPGRDRNIECPQCHQVVCADELAGRGSSIAGEPARAENFAGDTARIEALEARVAALEAALGIKTPDQASPDCVGKLQWFEGASGEKPGFSAEQSRILAHNLRTERTRKIIIRMPSANHLSHVHAMWFKEVFELANWIVSGPHEMPPENAYETISLAVAELPVTQEAAKTFLALKAAGFEVMPVLDPGLTEEGNAPQMALILPAEKSA